MKSQHRKKRLGDQLFEAFGAACDSENECLAFCLREALMIELSDRDGDRRHSQWKIDLIVQATLRDIVRPLPEQHQSRRRISDLILFPPAEARSRRRQPALGSIGHMKSYR